MKAFKIYPAALSGIARHKAAPTSASLKHESPDSGLEAAPQGRFSVIARLEDKVSLLQVATVGIERLKTTLDELRVFLEEVAHDPQGKIPARVAEHFVKDRQMRIRALAEAASFNGKALLNGNSGVKGKGTGPVRFVRGTAKTKASPAQGWPVAIEHSAKATRMVGIEPLTSQSLRRESLIMVSDGTKQAQYHIKSGESPDSFILGLRQELDAIGLEIGVYLNEDKRLTLVHHQLGSGPGFSAMSYHTRLLSLTPSRYRQATPGRDIAGTIADEEAQGKGGFLIGRETNRTTSGLVIAYEGSIAFAGEVVGFIKVEQNGMLVPLDMEGRIAEILSLPSLQPEFQAVGAPNLSGFGDLDQIEVHDQSQRRDALKVVLWALDDLRFLAEELKRKEEFYIELAVDLLRGSLRADNTGKVVNLSSEKASRMASELKGMLDTSLLGRVNALH